MKKNTYSEGGAPACFSRGETGGLMTLYRTSLDDGDWQAFVLSLKAYISDIIVIPF